jgi:hypothetical protein
MVFVLMVLPLLFLVGLNPFIPCMFKDCKITL